MYIPLKPTITTPLAYRNSQNKFTTPTVVFYRSLYFSGIDVFAFGQVLVHLFDKPFQTFATVRK